MCQAACGGGGGGGASPQPSTQSAPTPTPSPFPTVNHPPQQMASFSYDPAIIGYPFSLDIRTFADRFSDPDGDPISLSLQAQSSVPGLTIGTTTISGVPTEGGSVFVKVVAQDNRGGSTTVNYSLMVVQNSAPYVARPNVPQVASLHAPIAYDASQGGTTFADFHKHSLTYEITLTSAPEGFTATGTTVSGSFTAPGFVRGVIRARDNYGGTAEDRFVLAAPMPIASKPTLPAQSFVYDDALLPLPYKFRISVGRIIPLPDTTPKDNPTTNAGATLGRVLFYDKRLSVMNTHSCGSCHEQAHGFSIPRRFGTGVFGETTRRNPMGLNNVRYSWHNLYFGDLRTATLETLALEPIQDRLELGSTLPGMLAKLSATDFYPPLFEAAFGTREITSQRVSRALAQFLRSITSYQSRFDAAYHGAEETSPEQPQLLTDLEREGKQLFSDSQCIECHDTISTMADPLSNGLDVVWTDYGALTGTFRGGSLRNIVATAPYMHDGRFATLADVIEHYSTGIQPHVALHYLLKEREAPKRFNFTDHQKQALEAFLRTLTDNSVLSDPKFSDPFG